MENNDFCDPVTGVCSPASLEKNEVTQSSKYANTEIIYVGDPMCSWCWGIAPALKKLRDFYKNEGICFRTVVGGLRPGGGDPWDDQMKNFLKHHWQEVTAKSGQPFGYDLFERESFNYDTEPPCRAIVAARPLVGEQELEFFTAVKYKFYVASEDPGEESFYQSICEEFNVDYASFLERFKSETIRKETHDEFVLNRNWGVRGYPAVILKQDEKLYSITNGFATFEQMKEQVGYILSQRQVAG
ncbi:MAG: DsbA family protein [Cyclobacteriaceae bacterium]